MGLVDLGVLLDWPSYRADPIMTDGDTGAGITLNSSGDKWAYIVQIQKTGTLSLVHFGTKTVTVGDDLKISFQNVDANNKPDGTVDEYRVITIGAGDDNQMNVTGIVSSDGTDVGTKRSVTEGDWLAIVIEFDSFVAGNMQIANWPASSNYEPPWYSSNTGAGFGDVIGCMPCLGLEYDDGTFGLLKAIPAEDNATMNADTASTPDEFSMRFKLPFVCEAAGLFWNGGNEFVTVDLTTDAGTSLTSGPHVPAVSNAANNLRSGMFFPTKVELEKDVWYRLLFTPNHGSSVSWIATIDVSDAEMLAQWGFNSTNYQFGSRTDGGSWTDINTKLWPAGLYLSKLDDGTGSGGGCNFAGLANGTRVFPLAGA